MGEDLPLTITGVGNHCRGMSPIEGIRGIQVSAASGNSSGRPEIFLKKDLCICTGVWAGIWLTAQASMASACFPECVLGDYFMQRQRGVSGEAEGRMRLWGVHPSFHQSNSSFTCFIFWASIEKHFLKKSVQC